jgi:hypothetical protein
MMYANPIAAAANAHRVDLLRAAGCCTDLPQHLDALSATIQRRRRFSLRRVVTSR